ncbi:MAG: glycine betaine ABC transporter substrate-binding protein [Nocardioides sp.]
MAGAHFSVGSKEFTEEKILGQIAIQALENAGATVDDKTGITGTTNVRKALTSGQIDMYWEYTGTGFTELLHHDATEAPKDEMGLFDAVKKEDAKNGITWFALSSANDTYGIATSSDNPANSLSDYAKLANSNASDASVCMASEFRDRSDGWLGVQKAYGFKLPDSSITEVDLGIVFTQVPDQKKCNFGEVFNTDGRISANKMKVLEDDKSFFVKYDVAMTMDSKVYQKYPAVEKILDPIAKKLTTDELAQLNAQTDVQGIPEDKVAEQWLSDNGFS